MFQNFFSIFGGRGSICYVLWTMYMYVCVYAGLGGGLVDVRFIHFVHFSVYPIIHLHPAS